MGNQSAQTYLERMGAAQAEYRLLVGDVESTGQFFDEVPNTDTKSIYIENPSDSEVYVLVSTISIRAEGKLLVDKAFNVTEDTQGDPPDSGAINKRSDKDGYSINVRIGGTGETGVYSGGDSFSTKTVGSGGQPVAIDPGAFAEGLSNVIAPGDNMLVSATNDSGNVGDISIDIDFIEMPASEFP